MIKKIFFISYLLLILSSVDFIKTNDVLVGSLLIFRMTLYFVAFCIWISSGKFVKTYSSGLLYVLILLVPYVVTNAYMVAVDFLMLCVFSSDIPEEDYEYFVNKLVLSSLFLVNFIAILAEFDIISTRAFEWEDRVKNSMGFSNPNTFYYYLFSAAFALYFTNNFKLFLFCGLEMILLYSIVNSRTFLIGYFILLLFFLIEKFNAIKIQAIYYRIICFALIASSILIAVFPEYFSFFAYNMFSVDINELSSERIGSIIDESIYYSYLSKIFGGNANYADSLYIYWLNGVGVFGAIVVFILFVIKVDYINCVFGDKKIYPMTITILIVGVFELPYNGVSLAFLIIFLVFSKYYLSHRLKSD